MQKLYVSPSAEPKRGYTSRYFYFLKEEMARHYEVCEADNRPCLAQSLPLFRYAWKADVFFLSFVENIAFHKLAFIQCCIACAALWVMRLRRCRMVYFFHNIRPHRGENFLSRSLMKAQLKHACLVVSHSREAAEYARSLVRSLGGDPRKVLFRCHPAAPAPPAGGTEYASTDVLIWGNILPYKGVYEFVSNPAVSSSGLKVLVLGQCKDPALSAKIRSAASENIRFDNRRADFSEIAGRIRASRFVLFPYLPGSISSSGVLMDTVAMGGAPVGPDTGAFRDLAEEGLCFTYRDADGMLSLLQSEKTLAPAVRERFVAENSWERFADFLHDRLEELPPQSALSS